ncbi:hypothetical protein ABRP59_17110 [Pectobacterium punjabense]|uniref:hypothetical protein n=1 Tax=Pectobacterium punjabense TaxID=2108399 RepID=UPI0032EDE632
MAGELQHDGAPYRDSDEYGVIIGEVACNYFPNAVTIMLLAVNLSALDIIAKKMASDKGSHCDLADAHHDSACD